MSARSTFTNWGSSSSLVDLSFRPTGVIRTIAAGGHLRAYHHPGVAHGPELQEGERPSSPPDAFLPKDHRPFAVALDQHTDDCHHRGKSTSSRRLPPTSIRPLIRAYITEGSP